MPRYLPTALTRTDRIQLQPHLTVLRRDDHEIQLGFDSNDAAVLADPHGSLADLLEAMDGRYRLSELSALAAQLGIDASDLDALLDALTTAGLLQADTAGDHSSRVVRLIGLGPSGARIGEHLLQSGVGQLIVVDPDQDGSRHRWTSDRVQRADHWSQLHLDEPDLTIVVTSHLEVDRAISTTFTQTDHAHLVVRPRARGAVVGPLVVPGQTSCLRCGDLVRTRADPAWPRMLAQLCRISTEWDPLAAEWAAAMTATQVLSYLSGSRTESASATLELGPTDWQWRRRVWPADPACGCCWSPR